MSEFDVLLREDNPEFNSWVEKQPKNYWAKYDLSALRIGFEAGAKYSKTTQQLKKELQDLKNKNEQKK